MTYTEPLCLIFLLITGIGLIRLRRKSGIRLPTVGLFFLFLVSWGPCAWLLSRPLEAWYPAQPFQSAPAQAIVVLGAYVDAPTALRPYSIPGKDTYERCAFAAWLYHHSEPRPVLVCAGLDAKRDRPMPMMRQLLQREGIPDALIWSEERSRNTHENAVYGAEILRQRGISTIALVVEAQSMLRAERCFRKQGIAVVPAPCSFYKFQFTPEHLLPGWKAISRTEITLHESAGLVWYWLCGWI